MALATPPGAEPTVTVRRLLLLGPAMPTIYLAMFLIAASLSPTFSPLHDEPSRLGVATAPYAVVFNAGMVATATAGGIAAAGLFAGLRQIGSGGLLAAAPAASLVLASLGIAMAGLFPLPNPLHYGFGLTTAGVLAPFLGAIAMLKARNGRVEALLLAGSAALIVLLALSGAIPLIIGLAMFAAVAFLCLSVRAKL